MERIVMTWGFIPIQASEETIYCGDSETSGTLELNFEIIDNICKGIDNDFKENLDNNELWDMKSSFYKTISDFISDAFKLHILASQIYGGYVLVNDEPDDFSSIFKIIESEGGVFSNENSQYNGNLYLRHYLEEGNEVYDEKVCIGKIH